MQVNRRRFVQQTTSTLLALSTGGAMMRISKAEENKTLPIIDCHQHLWDLSKFKLRWLDSAEQLNRSYLTKDYLKAASGLNVVKAIYMEVDVVPRQQLAEAEHVIALCKSKDHPTAGAVISGRPASTRFKDYILQFKDSPYIKGVRQVLHPPGTKRGLCLEKQFVENMRLLGKLGMSYDLCMRPTELSDGIKLVDQCKETLFIVDHCGNADPKAFSKKKSVEKPWHKAEPWRRDIANLAKRKNTICKISGSVAKAPAAWTADDLAPIVNHCLDQFGPDRVVFGSDWPVCTLAATYRQWVEALKQIIRQRPVAQQRKLLHDNAVHFYRL